MRVLICRIIFVAMALCCSSVQAAITYSYIGSHFYDPSTKGIYTTSLYISGAFTVANPLPTNMALTNIGPGGNGLATGWSFTDGVNTFNNANSMVLFGEAQLFAVGTDSTGAINAYSIGFMSPPAPNVVGQPMNAIFFSSSIQQATIAAPCPEVSANVCDSIPITGANYAQANGGGAWSQVTAPSEVTLDYSTDGNGMLSGVTSQTIDYGGDGTAITAVPNSHYHFVQWSDGITANPRTDTEVLASVDVTAQFALDTNSVNVAVGFDGAASPSEQDVPYGGSASFTIQIGAHYHFTTTSDDCGSTSQFDADTGIYSVSAVTHPCTVQIGVEPDVYTLTTVSTSQVQFSPGAQRVTYGQLAYFTISLDQDYYAALTGDTCSPQTDPNGDGRTWWMQLTADCRVTVATVPYPVRLRVQGPAPLTPQGSLFVLHHTLTFFDIEQLPSLVVSLPQGVDVVSLSSSDPNARCYIGATVVWCYSQQGLVSSTATVDVTMRATGPVGSVLHSASHVETVFLGGWRSNEADTTTTISAGPDYVPLSPARLLDTRMGATTVDGIAAATEALAPGEVRVLPVINRGGLPNGAIDAVVLNIAAVMPTSPGYLTVWSGDGAVPGVGNLNLSIGRTLSTMVASKVNVSGNVSIYNGGTAPVDVTASVLGYFPLNSTYQPVTPQRFMDTRSSATTVDGVNASALAEGSQIDLPVAGRGPLPDTGVGAALFSVTGVLPTSAGYVAVWPTGDPLPAAGSLNLNPGITLSNATFTKIGAGGGVSFYNGSTTPLDLAATLQGWLPTQSGYVPITPQRFLDTRASGSTIDGQSLGAGAIQLNGTIDVPIAGRGLIPASGVSAVVLNFVAVNSTSGGYLTLWPTGEPQPSVGSINVNPGLTVPNLVIAKLNASGKVTIFSGAPGPTDVVVSVQGWFAGGQ